MCLQAAERVGGSSRSAGVVATIADSEPLAASTEAVPGSVLEPGLLSSCGLVGLLGSVGEEEAFAQAVRGKTTSARKVGGRMAEERMTKNHTATTRLVGPSTGGAQRLLTGTRSSKAPPDAATCQAGLYLILAKTTVEKFGYRRAVQNRPAHELVTENLRRLTEAKGVPLAVVADRAGIDRRELFEVMAGQREADLDWLNRLAEALEVHVAEFSLMPRRTSPKRTEASTAFGVVVGVVDDLARGHRHERPPGADSQRDQATDDAEQGRVGHVTAQ